MINSSTKYFKHIFWILLISLLGIGYYSTRNNSYFLLLITSIIGIIVFSIGLYIEYIEFRKGESTKAVFVTSLYRYILGICVSAFVVILRILLILGKIS